MRFPAWHSRTGLSFRFPAPASCPIPILSVIRIPILILPAESVSLIRSFACRPFSSPHCAGGPGLPPRWRPPNSHESNDAVSRRGETFCDGPHAGPGVCSSWNRKRDLQQHRHRSPTAVAAQVVPVRHLLHFSGLQRSFWNPSRAAMDVVTVTTRLNGEALNKIAVTTVEKSYSYADLLRSASELSAILVKELPQAEREKALNGNLKKPADGPRIGIMAKPCAEFVASMWAAWLNGMIAVPIALSYPEAEIHHVMTDADISMILATEEYKPILEKVIQQCPAKLYIIPSSHGEDKSSQNLDKIVADVKQRSSAISGEQGALIVYTSGTTGKPKGVVHTQTGLGAQVKVLAETWGYTSNDRFLHVLPLHHVHGLINALLAPLYAGAAVDFLPKFSVSGVWQSFKKSYPLGAPPAENPITAFTGVPTVYVRLLQGYDNMDAETRKESTYAASQLRLMMCGSSALPLPVMEKWESLTGHRLLERYGMTEFGMGLTNPLKGERRPGFVGTPFPGMHIKIGNSESGDAGVGELLLKSPSMFREYWRKPEVTADSFTEDGYFKTGDTITIEDGYVKILGRTSVDIIKVGGYKLSALEIESVLLEHPAIAECAVVGIEDKDYGESMSVVVVPPEQLSAEAAKKGEPVLTIQQLTQWAKGRMAPYKIPQQLLIWDSIPRNAMGKVNKKELKKEVVAGKQ